MKFVTNALFCLAAWGIFAGVYPAVGAPVVGTPGLGVGDAEVGAALAQAQVSPVSSTDWQREVVHSIETRGEGDFAPRLKVVKEGVLKVVASEIDAAYGDAPAATLAWLEALAVALGDNGAHAEAALLLNALVVPDGITGLERSVYARWVEQGGEGLQAMLGQWAEREGAADHAISIVASLYQGPYADRFDAYLEWIEQSPVALKGVLVQNLAPHLLRLHFDRVETLVVAHLDYGPFEQALYTLTQRRAEEDAAETLAWVAQIQVARPHLGIKMEAFGLVIRQMARADIDAATGVLKHPSFIATYFPTSRVRMTDANGDWSSLARWFHDESWRHFVEAVLDSHPKRAEEASKLFYTPQLLKDYRELFGGIS